jgi:hypothetical protein
VADAGAFEWVCSELEQSTSLERLEARGTVRLALKEAGLEARSVTPDQMQVVVDKILPRELASRGVADAESVCAALKRGLSTLDAGTAAESPDAVFQRLAGGR